MKNLDRYRLANLAAGILDSHLVGLGKVAVRGGDEDEGKIAISGAGPVYDLLDPAARQAVNDLVGDAAHYLSTLFRDGLPEEEPVDVVPVLDDSDDEDEEEIQQ